MSELNSVIKELKKFRDERDWEQFHNPKDLAIALSIEANELLECYLWKDAKDGNLDKIKEELADVLSFALLLLDKYELDFSSLMADKIAINKAKYPVNKSKGTAKKYNEL